MAYEIWHWPSASPATHKMHDFKPVARSQFGFVPFRTGQNRMVQFDGKTFLSEFELFDQIRYASSRIYQMRVAVNDYFDCVLSVHARDYPRTNHIFKVMAKSGASILSMRCGIIRTWWLGSTLSSTQDWD